MTLSTTTTEVSYTADGVQTDFPFAFQTQQGSDIVVYGNGVEILAGVIVTLNADQEVSPGGNVNITPAPADQAVIKIARIVPLTQQTDYAAYDPFPAETHEDALDKAMMAVQQVDAKLSPTGFVVQGFDYKDQTPSGASGGVAWGNIESLSYVKQKDSSNLMIFVQASLIESGSTQQKVTASLGITVDGSADLALANAVINGHNGTAWAGEANSIAAMRWITGIAAGTRSISIRGIVDAGTFDVSESQIFLLEIG